MMENLSEEELKDTFPIDLNPEFLPPGTPTIDENNFKVRFIYVENVYLNALSSMADLLDCANEDVTSLAYNQDLMACVGRKHCMIIKIIQNLLPDMQTTIHSPSTSLGIFHFII